MKAICVPRTNPNDDTCLLVEWLVMDGATVGVGAPIAVLETSKAAFEVAAEAEGIVVQVVEKGASCAVSSPIGYIAANDDDRRQFLAERKAGSSPELLVTAAAADLVKTHGLTQDDLRALGRNVIRRADVEELLVRTTPAPKASRHQQAVARTVLESHRTIPAAFLLFRASCTQVVEALARYRREARRYVGLTEVAVKIIGSLADEFPAFYEGLVAGRTPNIGLTMDVGKGLVVPVVREAGSRTIEQIAETIHSFQDKALKGGFLEEDFQGAHLSVSLHTERGVLFAIPFVVPGQRCIVSVSGILNELILKDGVVSTGQYVQVGVSYDHRFLNGFDAMMFLKAIAARIESATDVPVASSTPESASRTAPGATAEMTETEQLLSQWIAELLRVANVSPDADLFELGAHSLTMTSIASRILHEFGTEIPLHVLFDSPTVRHIGEALDTSLVEQAGSDEIARLLEEMPLDGIRASPGDRR